MKKLAPLFTLATLLLTTGSAFADYKLNTHIVRIDPWSDNTNFKIEHDTKCNNDKLVKSYTAYANSERVFDLAVAALLSGHQVQVDYECKGSIARITTMRLR